MKKINVLLVGIYFIGSYQNIQPAAPVGSIISSDWRNLIGSLERADSQNVMKIIPNQIGITQETKGGKTALQIARFWLEKRNSVVNYLLNATQSKNCTANSADWQKLIAAIESANLPIIQTIVPSKMSSLEKTRSLRTVLSVAQHHRDNQEKIVTYLHSLMPSQQLSSSISTGVQSNNLLAQESSVAFNNKTWQYAIPFNEFWHQQYDKTSQAHIDFLLSKIPTSFKIAVKKAIVEKMKSSKLDEQEKDDLTKQYIFEKSKNDLRSKSTLTLHDFVDEINTFKICEPDAYQAMKNETPADIYRQITAKGKMTCNRGLRTQD